LKFSSPKCRADEKIYYLNLKRSFQAVLTNFLPAALARALSSYRHPCPDLLMARRLITIQA
jgi:hypothetical protein